MNEQFEEDLSDLVHPYKKAIQNALDDNEDPDRAIEEAELVIVDLKKLLGILEQARSSFFVCTTSKMVGAELLYDYLCDMTGSVKHEIDCLKNSITDATAPDHNPDAPCKADKGVK